MACTPVMELPAVDRASRAFFLFFRRWCLINNSSLGRTRPQQRSHVDTLRVGARSTTQSARRRDPLARSAAISPPSCPLPRPHSIRTKSAQHRHYSSSQTRQNSKHIPGKLEYDLRHALRTLTKPCVVITAGLPDGRTWTGATLSSFDTISLDPIPQVSFNIKVPSRTYDALSQSGDVCVHILNATQQGALIADTFTKRYEDSNVPFQLLQKAGCTFTRGKDEMAPKLYIEGGVLARLICRRNSDSQEIDVGDHKLCTLTVVRVENTSPADSSGSSHALAYGQQAFRSLGEVVTPGIPSSMESIIAQKDDLDDEDLESAYHAADVEVSKPISTQRANVLTSSTIQHTAPSRMASAGLHTSSRLSKNATFYIPWTDQVAPTTSVPSSVMSQTVADFLCHSQLRPAPRTGQLRAARRLATEASRKLRNKAIYPLTTAEVEQLEETVSINERFIAGKLAYYAANDLHDMLDEARVSQSRIQYIEKCIEAGQAALLVEAKNFAQGVERKGFLKAWLKDDIADFERVDEHYRVPLMRLRDLHEDEDLD